MEIRTIGIDLGKTVFHPIGLNGRGEVVVREQCSRTQLLRSTSNLRSCLIGMEACGGSHFLGRALREQGHDVRLMPAQYVKPYVKTNKNDIPMEIAREAAWGVALLREAVIRPLAEYSRLSAESVAEAADQLGLSRTILYKLLQRYRRRPQTSSLLPWKRGRKPSESLLGVGQCQIRWPASGQFPKQHRGDPDQQQERVDCSHQGF